MTPLQLALTTALLDELATRFDHMAFAGVIEKVVEGQDERFRVTRLTGCRYVTQALGSSLMIRSHEELAKRGVPASEDDL
jgi:hypothetical protein